MPLTEREIHEAVLRGYEDLVTGVAKTEVGSWRRGVPFRSLDRMNALTLEVILRVEGEFRIGESVTCVNESGQEVARGLAGYSSIDVARLVGQRTNAIERVTR